MELSIAIFIGILYACGVFLLLRRSIVKVILGVFVLSNATNLIIFLAGGVERGGIGFVNENGEPAAAMSDPLPQALVLTAIVIGLGIAAYILVLKYQYFKVTGTHDLDQLKNTEQK
ncbi:multicomponent Na+:H+ antiporter subunit C [Breznakibacter xylanolyticus]|uniref:Multicomponent Na+:H+ antiporter subunit C n=1 Tax=Breznakibacter xylanolyticus TaxID=990 RepID=A0A2W7NAX2_9BACT|nr:NADH-quinone oxidoreductase subunit K [Breznakibacter xylanolyticus]MBN2743084.1 NADH-quinone oxidoreductase subunit K [Marinilabiliaceae bacterium]PZX17258.1 multicomponent Na+:H+ antiporter subunit C [Breznakibacter xylanolyticus]